MQEGPYIVFQKNKLQRFKGKTVSQASGTCEMDKSTMSYNKLLEIETFGEKMFFVFKDFFVSVDLGSSGSILVNKKKKTEAGFSLHFPHSEINFYGIETQFYEGKPTDEFNFKTDILKPDFDGEFVLNKLQQNLSEQKIGDVLQHQNLFTGIGNMIRIESLYRAKIHPESQVKNIPEKKLIFLIETVVNYSYEILDLLKTGNPKEKALIYEQKICPKDKSILLIEETDITKIKTWVCLKCQKMYHSS